MSSNEIHVRSNKVRLNEGIHGATRCKKVFFCSWWSCIFLQFVTLYYSTVYNIVYIYIYIFVSCIFLYFFKIPFYMYPIIIANYKIVFFPCILLNKSWALHILQHFSYVYGFFRKPILYVSWNHCNLWNYICVTHLVKKS